VCSQLLIILLNQGADTTALSSRSHVRNPNLTPDQEAVLAVADAEGRVVTHGWDAEAVSKQGQAP
jgi:hypothetical protein